MEIKDILIAARAKIADPANWTQGAWARDASLLPVTWLDPNAVCWCAGGAIVCACRGSGRSYFDVITALGKDLDTSIATYNDLNTHAAILAVFDAAIAQRQG